MWPVVGIVVAAVAGARPELVAKRVSEAPVLDGKLDDRVWAKAAISSEFTQKFPNEGQPPSERTSIRVLYDDTAVYVAVDCEQLHSAVVERLTRRGRLVESDWVSVTLGTRNDGRSAFEFTVNASGVLVDTLRYNDTEKTDGIEENWEASTARTDRGWSAEIRIPLRILRFSAAASQSWDFQARRHLSELQETDEWALISRKDGGEVSRYGRLDGLRDLTPRYPLELKPFVLGKFERRDPDSSRLSRGTFWSATAGLDLKWHAASDLLLEAAVNPDFAQVETDQLTLNLSNFETYYPEKRPFFSEGTDIFATPVQLVYTRRIGAALPFGYPQLRFDDPFAERLVNWAAPTRIYAASKLTGRIADGWSVGLLQAVTEKNGVDVQLADGTQQRRTAAPLTAYQALRVKRDLGGGYVGLTVTGTTYAEGSQGFAPGAAGPSSKLCPNAVTPTSQERGLSPSLRSGPALAIPSSSRCFNDAYVTSMDWQLRFADDWVFSGQVLASTLRSGAPRHVPDGTVIQPKDIGGGVTTRLRKDGGTHWLGELEAEYFGKKLDINDLGYQERAGSYFGHVSVEYRNLVHTGPFLETNMGLSSWSLHSPRGLNLETAYSAFAFGRFENFWQLLTEFEYRPPYFEDREVGDGTALERSGYSRLALELETNPTRRVSLKLDAIGQLSGNGQGTGADLVLVVRALPVLDLELAPTFSFTRGEPRFVGTNAALDQYLFGKLTARSAGVTVRGTYTFTPRLTLQGYAQLLLASGHYGNFSAFHANAPGAVVHLAALQADPAGPSDNPDFLAGALNLSAVMRWEYSLGSVAYLVYTRSQTPDVGFQPGQAANLRLRAVSHAPATDIILLKVSYWWG